MSISNQKLQKRSFFYSSSNGDSQVSGKHISRDFFSGFEIFVLSLSFLKSLEKAWDYNKLDVLCCFNCLLLRFLASLKNSTNNIQQLHVPQNNFVVFSKNIKQSLSCS